MNRNDATSATGAQRFCTAKDAQGTKKGNRNGCYGRNVLYR